MALCRGCIVTSVRPEISIGGRMMGDGALVETQVPYRILRKKPERRPIRD